MIFFLIITHCKIARIVYKTEEMYIFMWLASRLVLQKKEKKYSHGQILHAHQQALWIAVLK